MAGSSAPLRLRVAEFDRLTAKRGWTTDAQRADALGISRALMSRVRSGELRPGQKFIAAVLTIWGSAGYDVLFETDESDEAA
jgi:transcriptional regulator with XRE-family HTH domain